MSRTTGFNPAALAALADGDLKNYLVAATPGGIEAQEAAGQAELVRSASRLPKDGDWDALEKLGVQRCGDADDLFYNVTLPPGWSIRATDHSMWSDLVDENGLKRAAIFYKAAFYDRHAHFDLT